MSANDGGGAGGGGGAKENILTNDQLRHLHDVLNVRGYDYLKSIDHIKLTPWDQAFWFNTRLMSSDICQVASSKFTLKRAVEEKNNNTINTIQETIRDHSLDSLDKNCRAYTRGLVPHHITDESEIEENFNEGQFTSTFITYWNKNESIIQDVILVDSKHIYFRILNSFAQRNKLPITKCEEMIVIYNPFYMSFPPLRTIDARNSWDSVATHTFMSTCFNKTISKIAPVTVSNWQNLINNDHSRSFFNDIRQKAKTLETNRWYFSGNRSGIFLCIDPFETMSHENIAKRNQVFWDAFVLFIQFKFQDKQTKNKKIQPDDLFSVPLFMYTSMVWIQDQKGCNSKNSSVVLWVVDDEPKTMLFYQNRKHHRVVCDATTSNDNVPTKMVLPGRVINMLKKYNIQSESHTLSFKEIGIGSTTEKVEEVKPNDGTPKSPVAPAAPAAPAASDHTVDLLTIQYDDELIKTSKELAEKHNLLKLDCEVHDCILDNSGLITVYEQIIKNIHNNDSNIDNKLDDAIMNTVNDGGKQIRTWKKFSANITDITNDKGGVLADEYRQIFAIGQGWQDVQQNLTNMATLIFLITRILPKVTECNIVLVINLQDVKFIDEEYNSIEVKATNFPEYANKEIRFLAKGYGNKYNRTAILKMYKINGRYKVVLCELEGAAEIKTLDKRECTHEHVPSSIGIPRDMNMKGLSVLMADINKTLGQPEFKHWTSGKLQNTLVAFYRESFREKNEEYEKQNLANDAMYDYIANDMQYDPTNDLSIYIGNIFYRYFTDTETNRDHRDELIKDRIGTKNDKGDIVLTLGEHSKIMIADIAIMSRFLQIGICIEATFQRNQEKEQLYQFSESPESPRAYVRFRLRSDEIEKGWIKFTDEHTTQVMSHIQVVGFEKLHGHQPRKILMGSVLGVAVGALAAPLLCGTLALGAAGAVGTVGGLGTAWWTKTKAPVNTLPGEYERAIENIASNETFLENETETRKLRATEAGAHERNRLKDSIHKANKAQQKRQDEIDKAKAEKEAREKARKEAERKRDTEIALTNLANAVGQSENDEINAHLKALEKTINNSTTARLDPKTNFNEYVEFLETKNTFGTFGKMILK